jgi:chorismate mutase / prephenate dehydrogenase
MSRSEASLSGFRSRIDEIDEEILRLLQERKEIAKQVLETKIQNRLPIFLPGREDQKVITFREKAQKYTLDPEWAEDFLRMIMSSSRASQSEASFPRATTGPQVFLFVGGRGGMGSLYSKFAQASGHIVRILDRDNWDEAKELARGIDVAIITVPIHATKEVIKKLGPMLSEDAILADFTSIKGDILECMLEYHNGPVAGLHPMHGPDLHNLSKQLMVVCNGRREEEYQWLTDQFALWGMRVKIVDPVRHDQAMNIVQGLRHFIALLHGSFLNQKDMKPEEILDFSSPIYRAELMMTGRIFAQDAELYADIVFSDEERVSMLLEFLEHHERLAEMVRNRDKKAFISEFKHISAFFGDFGAQALTESGYLINRLADRFS